MTARRGSAPATPCLPCLEVDHPTERVQRRFGYRLRQGRMGMNCQLDFFHGKLVFASHRKLVNDFGCMRADDVRAQYLAVLGVREDLYKALGLARSPCAAVGGEGESADLVRDVLLLQLALGLADRCDLRMAIRGVRNVVCTTLTRQVGPLVK